MFDSAKKFTVRIVSGGVRSIDVRFPTDQEWATRARTSVLRERRGESDGGEIEGADLALFECIRQDGQGNGWDAIEAAEVLRKLGHTETRAEVVGDCIEVDMGAMVSGEECRFKTRHTLRMPTQAQMMRYRRSVLKQETRGGTISTSLRLEPGGELYDALVNGHEGYTGAVPLPHKDAVVTASIAAVNRFLTEDVSPEV